VVISREGFTARAEIGIIADSAFEANTVDVTLGRLVLAKRTIAEDAIVDLMLTSRLADGVINLHKTMARVMLRGSQYAVGTEVPIRTGQALVTNANDTLYDISFGLPTEWTRTYLVTAVADSGVAELPARQAARCDQILQAEFTVRSKVEGVARVVTMLVTEETAETKIIIFAVIAAYEIALICLCFLLAIVVKDV
jgi:hypothetical protein